MNQPGQPELDPPAVAKIVIIESDDSPTTIQTILDYPRRGWKWHVGRRDFEVIHGLSRVTETLPIRLTTAQAIRLAAGPSSGDSQLNLSISLIDFYAKVHEEKIKEKEADHQEEQLLGDKDLKGAINELRAKTQGLVSILNREPLFEFFTAAQGLVDLADDIQQMCCVYLHFVHPLNRMVTGGTKITKENIAPLRQACLTRSTRMWHRLRREFLRLSTHNALSKLTMSPESLKRECEALKVKSENYKRESVDLRVDPERVREEEQKSTEPSKEGDD